MTQLTANEILARAESNNSFSIAADLEYDWTKEQAQGLLDSLKLVGAVPNWKAEHLKRLYDWCTSNHTDHKTIEGQLEFVAYDICSSYPGIGIALKQADTVEESRQAVEGYVKLLTAPD